MPGQKKKKLLKIFYLRNRFKYTWIWSEKYTGMVLGYFYVPSVPLNTKPLDDRGAADSILFKYIKDQFI